RKERSRKETCLRGLCDHDKVKVGSRKKRSRKDTRLSRLSDRNEEKIGSRIEPKEEESEDLGMCCHNLNKIKSYDQAGVSDVYVNRLRKGTVLEEPILKTIDKESGTMVKNGELNGKRVKIIRDSGCTSVLVKSNVVRPENTLGTSRSVMFANSIIRSYPTCVVRIKSPWFTGQTEAIVVDDCVYDVILGNIPGASCPCGTKIDANEEEENRGVEKTLNKFNREGEKEEEIEDDGAVGNDWSIRKRRGKGCLNCGERYHVREKCWFRAKVRCRRCFGLGHKEKFCTR
ncbi:MAG: retropepsin-like domain-containing protein, partial [Candidatus Omnitrophica bacterium]|nr:retropepsin-like domain-containing protein [Candidatus Omnitrophota bacterium]